MKLYLIFACLVVSITVSFSQSTKSPLEDLPDYINQTTYFGERADWSHDGERVLFIEKTFGDVFEV